MKAFNKILVLNFFLSAAICYAPIYRAHILESPTKKIVVLLEDFHISDDLEKSSLQNTNILKRLEPYKKNACLITEDPRFISKIQEKLFDDAQLSEEKQQIIKKYIKERKAETPAPINSIKISLLSTDEFPQEFPLIATRLGDKNSLANLWPSAIKDSSLPKSTELFCSHHPVYNSECRFVSSAFNHLIPTITAEDVLNADQAVIDGLEKFKHPLFEIYLEGVKKRYETNLIVKRLKEIKRLTEDCGEMDYEVAQLKNTLHRSGMLSVYNKELVNALILYNTLVALEHCSLVIIHAGGGHIGPVDNITVKASDYSIYNELLSMGFVLKKRIGDSVQWKTPTTAELLASIFSDDPLVSYVLCPLVNINTAFDYVDKLIHPISTESNIKKSLQQFTRDISILAEKIPS